MCYLNIPRMNPMDCIETFFVKFFDNFILACDGF